MKGWLEQDSSRGLGESKNLEIVAEMRHTPDLDLVAATCNVVYCVTYTVVDRYRSIVIFVYGCLMPRSTPKTPAKACTSSLTLFNSQRTLQAPSQDRATTTSAEGGFPQPGALFVRPHS